MKNKIILLLVLLIPSLCFGKSVKFTISEKIPNKVTNIEIEITGEEQFKAKFVTKQSQYTPDRSTFGKSSYIEMFIYLDENKKEIVKFFQFCKLHFPASYTENSKKFLSNGNQTLPFQFCSFFESLLIQNNFAVTYKDETERNTLVNAQSIFFYRPDK